MENWTIALATIVTLLLSIPLLNAVAARSPSARLTFTLRWTAAVLAMIASSSFGVVASVLLHFAGYGGLSQYVTGRAFEAAVAVATGVTFSVTDPSGALKQRPAVFVGNHQTELDVAMLGAVFPPYTSVTSKASLKYYPFLGWFMLLSRTVFIDRTDKKGAKAAFDGAVRTMRDTSQSVFIFPEGTRSYYEEPKLLPFKKGAFHLAVQAQVPLVPVVVANYSYVLNMKQKVFNTGNVPISILPAISTEGMTSDDVAALTERVQKLMLEELVRLDKLKQAQGVMVDGKATGMEQAIKH